MGDQKYQTATRETEPPFICDHLGCHGDFVHRRLQTHLSGEKEPSRIKAKRSVTPGVLSTHGRSGV